MADAIRIDEFEQRLRHELEAAEQQWRDATPPEKPEARRRFLEALHRFSVLAFAGGHFRGAGEGRLARKT